MEEQSHACPKCGETSGNDWSQCEGVCPIASSPHFDPQAFDKLEPAQDRFRKLEIDELAKASTAGMGNRKERRRRQADLKRMMRKG